MSPSGAADHGHWKAGLDPHIVPELARSALVVIDTQKDFLDDGSSGVAGTIGVLPNIGRLVTAYRDGGRPIVHVVRFTTIPT
jgi:hypothetical protein